MSNRRKVFDKIGEATFIIIIISIGSKIFAMLKEIIVASKFGTSPELDGFNIAYAYPAILILFISGAMIPAFVPLYIEWEKQSKNYADRNTTKIFFISIFLMAVITTVSYLFKNQIYRSLGFGFNNFQLSVCISMSQILLLMILLEGGTVIPQALIHSKKKFVHLNVLGNFQNLGIIVLLVTLHNKLGIYAMAWGVIVGSVAKFIYSLWVVRSSGVNLLNLEKDYDLKGVKIFLLTLLPLLGSEMIANFNIFIDQIMATKLGEGAVSTLRYAYRVNDIPIQIIIMALTQAIFPFLSEQALNPDKSEMTETFKIAVVFVTFLSLPITFLVLLYSTDIVAILFQRGAFDELATKNTSEVLVCYSFGLVFYGYSFINGNFFVSLRRGQFLFWVGLISILLNISFNFLFMYFFGVKGIALSTSVTICAVSVIFMWVLKKFLKIDLIGCFVKNFLIILMGCCIMMLFGLGFKMIMSIFSLTYAIFTVLSVFLLCCVYTVSVYILKSRELSTCISILMGIISKLGVKQYA